MQHLRLLRDARPASGVAVSPAAGRDGLSGLGLVDGSPAPLGLAGQGGAMPDFFAANPFMPNWPDLPPVAGVARGSSLMLLGPKLLGIAAHIRDRGLAWARAPGFALSVLVEIALSFLIAPTLMVHQVRAVVRTLAGFDGGWMPHAAGRAPADPAAVSRHRDLLGRPGDPGRDRTADALAAAGRGLPDADGSALVARAARGHGCLGSLPRVRKDQPPASRQHRIRTAQRQRHDRQAGRLPAAG